MARIRSIKPEFWSDEKLAPMPVATRLLFLALICMADDCGRIIDSVSQIVAFMHPYTDEETFANVSRETRESLASLSESGRIVRGVTASGQRVVQITNWSRHQKVDHPNTRAALPELVAAPTDTHPRETLAKPSREVREPLASNSRDDLRSTIYDQDLRSAIVAHAPVVADATPDPGADGLGNPAAGTIPVESANWVTALHGWWTEHVGAVEPGALGRFAKPVRRKYGTEKIKAAALVYASADEGPKRFRSPKDFFTNFVEWHKLAETPLVDEDGILTDRGRRLGGDAR